MSDDESEDAEFTGGEEEEEGEKEEMGGEEESNGDEEAGNDSADEEPDSGGRKAKRRISYAEQSDDNGEEDDSEDDIPLAQLAAGKKAANKKANESSGTKKKTNGKKKEAPASPANKKAKAAASNKKAAAASAVTTATDKSYEHASAAMYGTECDKGLLIQRLLCRWWYAYEWPTNIREKPPKNYDPLDGFKGVFICTAGDDAGHIMDTRDHATRPCFVNFARKPSSKLKSMLLQAIDGQLAALEADQHLHDNTASLQKELKEMRRWAAKVDADKADHEAEKVLKAAKLKLPEIPG